MNKICILQLLCYPSGGFTLQAKLPVSQVGNVLLWKLPLKIILYHVYTLLFWMMLFYSCFFFLPFILCLLLRAGLSNMWSTDARARFSKGGWGVTIHHVTITWNIWEVNFDSQETIFANKVLCHNFMSWILY